MYIYGNWYGKTHVQIHRKRFFNTQLDNSAKNPFISMTICYKYSLMIYHLWHESYGHIELFFALLDYSIWVCVQIAIRNVLQNVPKTMKYSNIICWQTVIKTNLILERLAKDMPYDFVWLFWFIAHVNTHCIMYELAASIKNIGGACNRSAHRSALLAFVLWSMIYSEWSCVRIS